MKQVLTQINKAFELFAERKLAGSDQLIYLHLLNAFNRAHFPETLRITDKALLELIRLYDTNGKPASIETVRRSKQRLKAKGFIDFTPGKGSGISEYTLPCLYPTDTRADTLEQKAADSNTVRAEDVKEKDVKTLSKKEMEKRAREEAVRVREELSDAVYYEWIQAVGEAPFGGNASDLCELQKEYGTSTVVEAIRHCRRNNPSHTVRIIDISRKLKSATRIAKPETPQIPVSAKTWENQIPSWLNQ